MSEQLNIIIKGDAAQFTRTMNTVDRAIQKAQGSVRTFGHSTTSNTQAASAAIRLLEGDMNNMVRAAENFVGRSQVLSGVLKSAFPVIGAVAIGAVIAEGTQKLIKFIETANRAPQAIQNAFRSLSNSMQLANDDLQKVNDQLSNEILKLEGKPQNNLLIALDDARKMADKLADSLDSDNKKVADLLKANNVGFTAATVTGQESTNTVSGSIRSYNQQLSDLGSQRATFADNYTTARRLYGDKSPYTESAKAALDQSDKALRDKQDSYRQWIYAQQSKSPSTDWVGTGIQQLILGNTYTPEMKNSSAVQAELAGALRILNERQEQQGLEAQNAPLVQRQQQLQHAKDFAEEQKKANEQVQKNVRDILAQRKENDQQMANYARTPGLIAPHPLLGMNGQPGSTPQGLAMNVDLSRNPDMTKGLGDASKAAAGWLRNMNEGVAIQKANADALAEQSLQMAIATGRISRLDAAQVQAQLHTREYTEALKTLQGNRAAIMARTDLSPLDRKQQLSGIDNQITTLRGQRAGQSAQDQAAIQAATTLGQLSDATSRLMLQFGDFGAHLADLMTSAITETNQALASSLMAHAYNGRDYRRNIVNSLSSSTRNLGAKGLNYGFQGIEGTLFGGKFGKGKPDGTSGNPLHVILAGAASTAGAVGSSTSRIGGFFSRLFHLGGSSPSALGGSYDPLGLNAPTVDVSGMAASMPSFPMFGNGGVTPSNMPFIVGDRGPELMQLPYSTHITPNHRMASSLGSTTTTSISVDARGSSDPAAVHAAAQQAVLAAVPHILEAAHASRADQRRRTVGPS